jgi:hypothetical protein
MILGGDRSYLVGGLGSWGKKGGVFPFSLFSFVIIC